LLDLFIYLSAGGVQYRATVVLIQQGHKGRKTYMNMYKKEYIVFSTEKEDEYKISTIR